MRNPLLKFIPVLLIAASTARAQTTWDVAVGPSGSFSFSPGSLTIQLGDTVHWTWQSGGHSIHSGTAAAPTTDFTMPVSGTGTTFDVTFDSTFVDAHPVAGGIYDYFCDPHALFGMTGSITVESPPPTDPEFIRGDCNSDGANDIADAIAGLGALFSGGSVDCIEACDVNDDSAFDIADMIYLLSNLFTLGDAPPSPFPTCGEDPTADALGCDLFTPCP